MKPRTFFIIAFLATVSAGPVNWRNSDEGQCASRCTTSSKFQYELGKTYQFRYNAETVTALQGAAEEHSGLHISATADIEVLSKCELVLKMHGVNLESTNRDPRYRETVEGAEEFRRALERSPLRFSFQDGRIEELCPAENEPEWVLNIKRGVLAAFQNSMDKLEDYDIVDETDVTGNCKAKYWVSDKSYNTMTINKYKYLDGCTERHGNLTALQATPYRVHSTVQSMPVLKSNHTCKQTIFKSSGRLQKSECEETHIFRPFSRQENGAMTRATQTLEFIREQSRGRSERAPIGRRTNMLFEHKYAGNKEEDSRREAIAIMTELCRNAKDEIRAEVPALFARLVYKLRDLNAVSLRAVYDHIVRQRMCKQFFLDAIPMLGTSASARLIKQLIVDKTVTGLESDAWLTSLAFAKEPTTEMLREVKAILEQPTVDRAAYLSISAMVNTYCRVNANCGRVREVLALTKLFEDNLNGNCRGDREKILMSLKAIGNAGNAVSAIPALNRCFMEKNNPIEIRLAAMEAFRRLPCEGRENLMRMVQNTEEDSEIRIAAYLAVMQCPSREVVSQVRTILEKEEINQVGSFIWTHMTNLMETSDIHKQDIREIVEDEDLKKTFDLDKRKFSRNIEKSLFFDSINTGAKVESNLIWSTKSYIPRSAMLNLTVDLFGSSMNLLEVGGRIEGMEYLLERYFGPMGVFGKENMKKMAKERKVNLDGKLEYEDLAAPVGSAFIKIFGNEMGYLTSEDLKVKSSKTFLDVLIELAEGKQVDFSKSMMLLDTSYIVPTLVGLPMNLSVNATASVNVKIGGKLDLRTLPRNINVDGHIRPSGAVEVSSLMGVDAHVTRNGLKMVSTMHSSTHLEGKIQVKDGQIFAVEFKTPKEQMELLDVKTKFFVVHRGEEREQRMITEGRTELRKCTGDQLAKITGLELCGEVSLPKMVTETSPFYPLTGPTSVKLMLNKRDTHSSYVFDARMENQKDAKTNKPVYTAHVAFNTPGSKINREFSVDLTLNEGTKTANFGLVTPWKAVNAEGAFVNTKALKKLQVTLVLDKKTQYSLLSELAINQKPIALTLTPNFELHMPGRKPVTLKGSLSYKKNKNMAIDLSLDNVFAKPVAVKGNVGIDKKPKAVKYSSNMQLKSPWVNSNFQGFAEAKTMGIYRSRIIATYNTGRKNERTIFNFKMRDMSTKATKKIKMVSNLAMTQFPDYNVQANWDLLVNKKHAENAVDIRYGRNPKDFSKRIYLSQVYNHVLAGVSRKIDFNMKLKSKSLGLDFSTKLNHKNTNKDLKTDAIVEYKPNRKVILAMVMKNENTAKQLKMSGDIKLTIPRRELRLASSLEEKTPNVYSHEALFQWQKGAEVKAISEYKNVQPKVHAFRTTITSTEMAPLTIAASTRLIRRDFAANAEVTYNRKTYASDVSYKYIWGRTKSFQGKIDLRHPARHVLAAVQGEAKQNDFDGKVELKWDADRDASKKVVLQSQYKDGSNSAKTHHEAMLKVSYPGRTVSIFGNVDNTGNSYNANGGAQWAPSKKVTVAGSFDSQSGYYSFKKVSLNFTSPFEKFEDLNLGLSAGKKGNKYNGEMDFSWEARKQIKAGLDVELINGLRAVNTELTVSTPFRGYYTTLIKSNHKIEPTEFVATIDASAQYKKAKLTVNGQRTSNGFTGALNFQSPFESLRSMSFNTNNAMTSRYVRSTNEFAWNSKKMEASVVAKNEGDRYKNNVEGSISVKTPFSGYEDMSLTAKHNDDSRTFTSSIEGNLGRKTAAVKFNMVHTRSMNQGKLELITPDKEEKALTWQHRLSRGNMKSRTEGKWGSSRIFLDLQGNYESVNKMSGSMRFQSPFYPFRDVSFKMDHEISQAEGKHLMEITYERSKKIMLKIEGSAEDHIEGKVLFTSPYPSLERISANFNAKTDSMPYTGHAEISWAPSKTISLDGTFSNYRSTEGTLRFSSPFENFETLAFTFTHAKRQSMWVSSSSFEYAPSKKIEIESKVQYDGEYKYVLDIKTLCPYFKNFHVEAEHNSHRGKDTKFAMSYTGTERVALEASCTAYGLRRINSNIKFTSSFRNYEQLSMTLKHFLRGEEYTTDVDVEYQPRRKVEVQTKINTGSLGFEIDIKSPMREMRSFKAQVQHSGTISSFNSKANFAFSGLQRVSLDSSLRVSGLRYINGEMKFTSPFENFEQISMSVNHGKGREGWISRAEVSYKPEHKIEVEGRFNNDDALKGSIEMKTPFYQARFFKAEIDHQGDLSSFTSKANMNFQGIHEISFVSSLKATGFRSIDGSIKFVSPYTNFENLELTLNHGKKGQSWESRSVFVYAPRRQIEVQSTFQNEGILKGTFDIKTPYYSFRSLHAQFEHGGNFPRIFTKGSFNIRCQREMSFDGNLNMRGTNYINGNAKFTGLFNDMEASIKHGKNSKDWNTRATLEYARNKKIELVSKFSNEGKIALNFNLRTPCPYFRLFEGEFEHSGAFPTFTTKGKATYIGQHKITLEKNIAVNGIRSITGFVHFTSPFTNFEEMRLSVNHGQRDGTWVSRGVFMYQPSKEIIAETTFSMDEGLKGSLSIQTPFRQFRSLNANFDHTGNLDNFRTTGALEVQPTLGRMTMETKFRNRRYLIEGGVKMTTEFYGYENFQADFSHREQSESRYVSKASVGTPRKTVAVSSEMQLLSLENFNGDITFTSPFEKFEFLRLAGSHKGNLRRMNCHLEAQYTRANKIIIDNVFSNDDQITGQIKLQSPWPRANFELDYSHAGELTHAFKSHAEVKYSGQKTRLDVDLALTPEIEGKIRFQSPFERFEDITFSVNHRGNLNRFNSAVLLKYSRREQIELTGSFVNAETIQGNVALKTPFRNFEHLHGSFKHEGELTNFKSSGEFTFAPSKKIEASVQFSKGYRTSGKASLKTPFENFEDINLDFSHQGRRNNFKSEASFSYAPKRTIEGHIVFRNIRSLIAKANLKTPFSQMRQLDVDFEHEGTLMNFKTSAEARYNRNRIQSSVEFNAEENIHGKATLKTPYKWFENLALSFNHEGSLNNFRSTGEFQMSPRKIISGNVAFQNGAVFSVQGSLKTPFRNYEEMSASYTHEGPLNDFKCNYQVNHNKRKLAVGTIAFKNAGAIEGKATLTTPFRGFEDMSASFNFRGFGSRGFRGNAEVNYPPSKKMTAAAQLNIGRTISGSASLVTPYFSEIAASFNHEGELTNFKSNAQGSYGNHRVAASANHEGELTNFKSNVQASYNSHRVAASVNHEGELASFRSNAEGSYNDHKVAASVNHAGELRNFKTNAEASYGREKFLVNAELNTERKIEGKLAVKTPYSEDMSLNFKHEGPINMFKSEATFQYSPRDKIEARAELNAERNIQGKLAVKTPFNRFEDMSLNFKHQGPINRFNTEATFQYSPRHKIEARADFAHYGQNIRSNFALNTPFRHLQRNTLNFRHEGDLDDFKSTLAIDNTRSGKYQLATEYKAEDGVPSKGSITYNCPHHAEKKVSFTHGRQGEKYISSGIYSWGPRKQVVLNSQLSHRGDWLNKVAEGELKMTTPFPSARSMRWAINHQHANMRFLKHNIQFEQNNEKKLDMDVELRNGERLTGRANMRVPYPMAADFDVLNTDTEFNGNAKLNWNTRDRNSNVQFNFGNKDESNRYRTKRSINVKTITPSRTMAFSTEMDKSRYSFQHKSQFAWDEARNKKVSYDINFSDRSRGSNKNYNLAAKLNTPVRDMEMKWSHKGDNTKFGSDAEFKWDASRDANRKLNMKATYERRGNQHQGVISLKHPKMQKDWSIRGDLTMQPTLYSGKTEIDFSTDPRQKLTMTGKVQDVSGNGNNYTMEVGVTHPRSSIDMSLISHIGQSNEALSAAMDMNYLTARRQRTNIALRGAIDKLRKSMNFEMVSPMKTIHMNGKMSGNENRGYLFNLVNTYDRSRSVQTELAVNPRQNNFDMKIKYSPENAKNMIHLTGKLVSDKSIQFEAVRYHNNARYSEGLVSFNLNNSHLLHSHIHWRPSSLFEAKKHGQVKANEIGQALNRKWGEMKNAVADEFRARKHYIPRSLPDMTPVSEVFQSEAESFSQDAQTIMEGARRMFWRNEFYMKDAARHTERLIDELMEYYQQAGAYYQTQMRFLERQMEISKRAAYKFFQEHKYKLGTALFEMEKTYEKCYQRAVLLAQQAKDMYKVYREVAEKKAVKMLEEMAEAAEPYFLAYYDFYNRASDKYSQVMEVVEEKMNEIEEKITAVWRKIMAHPTVKKTMWRLRQHGQKLSEIDFLKPIKNQHLQTFAKKYYYRIRNMVNRHSINMNKKANAMADQYSSAIYAARDKIRTHINNMDFQGYTNVKDMAIRALEKAAWAFEYYEVEKNTIETINTAVKLTKKFLIDNVYQITNAVAKFDRTRIIMWDLKKGEIQFEVYIPTEWPRLKSFPKIDFKKYITEMKEWIDDHIPEIPDYSLWDYYYQYKPTSDITNWIPPFKGFATLTGTQHYMTFDKKYFEFAGACSYTLVKDMVDNNFTVSVNYAGGEKTLSLTTDDKTFEISGEKAKFENREVELPFTHKGTTMTLTGSAVNIISKKGVKVTCNMEYDVCTVELAGWYFGKTAGLFGTYDNEPSTDFAMANGRITTNLEQFASSWAQGCRRHNNLAREFPEHVESQTAIECAKVFKNMYSSLRPCYKIVDPTPFYRMCINDMEMMLNSAEANTAMCKTSALYRTVCQREGVYMNMPTTCVRCNKADFGHFQEGEELNVTAAPQTADIVFVVEERECNSDVGAKLGRLAWQIDTVLRGKGFENNKYGLIGFGGECGNDEVHSHSVGGQMMNDARKFNSAANSLVFKNGYSSDALAAVRLAAMYPFRTGVAKTVVLVTCGACNEQNVKYAEVQSLLQDRDVTLHLLTEHHFKMVSDLKSPKSNYIFGVDDQAAFTHKDVSDEELTGDEALFRQLQMPKDVCAALAQENKGSVFNSNKFITGRVNYQKSFEDVFARRVAAIETSPCQVCECVHNRWGVGKTICRPCQVELQPAKPHLLGHKGENPMASDFDEDFKEYIEQ